MGESGAQRAAKQEAAQQPRQTSRIADEQGGEAEHKATQHPRDAAQGAHERPQAHELVGALLPIAMPLLFAPVLRVLSREVAMLPLARFVLGLPCCLLTHEGLKGAHKPRKKPQLPRSAHEPAHTRRRSAHKPKHKRYRSRRRGRARGTAATSDKGTQSRGATESSEATSSKEPTSRCTKGGGAPTGPDVGDNGAP